MVGRSLILLAIGGRSSRSHWEWVKSFSAGMVRCDLHRLPARRAKLELMCDGIGVPRRVRA